MNEDINAAPAMLPVEMKRARRASRFSQTAAYFAAFIGLGLSIGSLGPTLPSLAEQSHVSLGTISYLFAARSLGYVLGALCGGKLFDKRPGNPVIATTLIVMATVMVLTPLAFHIWLLLIAMLVLGTAEAALDVGANTLLVWVHGNRVAPFMNAMHSFFGVGALLAPIVVAQTALLQYPATYSYFVLALLLLPGAAYTLRLPSPVPSTRKSLERQSKTNYRLAFLIALFLFLYVGAEVGFAGWIFTYTFELKLSNATTAAFLTSLFWGALTLGRMLTIPVAARFKSGPILILSLVGCLLSAGLMLISARAFAAVVLGTAGLGLSMASIFPTTLALAGERMKLTGRLTGWFVFGSSAGSMLIPLIIGQLFQLVGPRSLMLVTTITLLTAIGVLVLVLEKSRAALNGEGTES
ncbi:MAG TPA: MFS transporter [Pyrinomonadaceae bacterium]|nr:MFS transporter [Pyrinomonadaceae bacterium]